MASRLDSIETMSEPIKCSFDENGALRIIDKLLTDQIKKDKIIIQSTFRVRISTKKDTTTIKGGSAKTFCSLLNSLNLYNSSFLILGCDQTVNHITEEILLKYDKTSYFSKINPNNLNSEKKSNSNQNKPSFNPQKISDYNLEIKNESKVIKSEVEIDTLSKSDLISKEKGANKICERAQNHNSFKKSNLVIEMISIEELQKEKAEEKLSVDNLDIVLDSQPKPSFEINSAAAPTKKRKDIIIKKFPKMEIDISSSQNNLNKNYITNNYFMNNQADVCNPAFYISNDNSMVNTCQNAYNNLNVYNYGNYYNNANYYNNYINNNANNCYNSPLFSQSINTLTSLKIEQPSKPSLSIVLGSKEDCHDDIISVISEEKNDLSDHYENELNSNLREAMKSRYLPQVNLFRSKLNTDESVSEPVEFESSLDDSVTTEPEELASEISMISVQQPVARNADDGQKISKKNDDDGGNYKIVGTKCKNDQKKYLIACLLGLSLDCAFNKIVFK